MLPKTRAYVKSYNGQTKYMYFLNKNDGLLGKYKTILDKVNADTKKNLIATMSAIKNFLKTKLKSIGDEVRDFCDKETRWTLKRN